MTPRRSIVPSCAGGLEGQRDARAGFTLPELLVVIGIVALLLAVLLPAIARARAQAKSVACSATLRQIGVGATLHQSDHQGYLPVAGWHFAPPATQPSAYFSRPPGGVACPDGLGDASERRYTYYNDSGIRRPVPLTAALGAYLGAPVERGSRAELEVDMGSGALTHLFRCVGQDEPLSGLTQRDDVSKWTAPAEYSSYVFNEAVLGVRERTRVAGPAPLVGNVVRARSTATVMLGADGRPRNQTSDNWLLVFDQGPAETLYDFQQRVLGDNGWGKDLFDHARHRGRMNVLFLDGHVESVPMSADGLRAVGVSKGVYE